MVVKNISSNGLGMIMPKEHDLHQGDILEVNFMLNDGQQTEISRIARISRIGKQRIGCEFVKKPLYDKHLGFYLLN